MQMLLESGNPVSYTGHTRLTMYYINLAVTLQILSMFLYDYVLIFLL